MFGPGLYVWALQVYTKRVISELVIEVVFESKNSLHYTFVELQNGPDHVRRCK
jgi:hypothetical protein